MAKKYLDDSGLSYLWGKLKDIFQVKLVSGTNIKTINNNSLLGSGNITISGGGSSVTVDDALSTTSENPVQNKVITNNFDNYLPLTGGVLTDKLTVMNHSSEIGDYKEVSPSAAVSVASGTSTPLCSLTLDGGTWIIRGAIRFPTIGTDRTKYVYANISSTSGSTSYLYRAPAENMITATIMTAMVKITVPATYYLNVYQNSGSAKSFTATYQELRAVRIA